MDDLLDKFKREVALDADAMSEQRDAANEDMRFIAVDGGQWEGFLENTHTENRVKAEFDIVSGYKNRTLAEWNNNRVGVEYKPDDEATTDDDAELLTGMYRADFRDGDGKQAVKNAVNEALTCGFGAWQMKPVYEDEEDPESDAQRIIWEPLFNAYNSVFFDSAAQREDKKDARRCTILIPFTKESFEEQWPDSKPVSAYTPSDRSVLNNTFASNDVIFIATRYEVVKKKERAYIYQNLESGETEVYSEKEHKESEAELKASNVHEFVRTKKVVARHVMMSRFSGDEILEKPRRIAGKWIGVIPVYGYRSYVDGKEWYHGVVRKLKDAARVMNVQLSQLIEIAAGGGDRVPIFDPEQMEDDNVRASWAERTNNAFKLAHSLTDKEGKITHVGPVGYVEPPVIGTAATTLMEFAGAFVRDMTGGAPQDTIDPATSGKALNAIQKREDRNTQPIFENIADGIEHSGVVYQAIAGEVYDTPRMVRTLGLDGTHGKATLFQIVADPKTGRLVESNTLRGKRFRAYSDVGPQYESMREQTAEEMKGMLEALSTVQGGEQYIPAIIDTLLQNTTGVGLGPLKKKVRQSMLLQGLVEPESDEDKEFLAQASQPQEDPQQKLMDAAAQQQLAEAENLRASSLEKAASAQLKQAQTEETLAGIETDQIKTLAQIRAETLRNLQPTTLQ